MAPSLTATPRTSPGMWVAFVLGGVAMAAFGAWVASIAWLGWVFVVLGSGGVGVGLWGLFSKRLRVRLDANGVEVVAREERFRATFAEVVAMQRADHLGMGRHVVLLEDGRSFVVGHDWQGAKQVIACLAHRHFDPALTFDLRRDDAHQADRAELPDRVNRFAERLAAEGRAVTEKKSKKRRRPSSE